MLHITTRGIPLFRLPFSSSKLVTIIQNSDGSTAYTSTRNKRSSSSCILSSPSRGDLISTTYQFGPGRPPMLRYVDTPKHAKVEEIVLQGKWVSHSQTFSTPAGKTLEWGYVRDADGKSCETNKFLTLTDISDGRKIAQLVRMDGMRAEGSRRTSAGNGGVLFIDEGSSERIEEALIVATCLVMLKKEIDRRRCLQGMVIGAAASGRGS